MSPLPLSIDVIAANPVTLLPFVTLNQAIYNTTTMNGSSPSAGANPSVDTSTHTASRPIDIPTLSKTQVRPSFTHTLPSSC